MGDPARLLLTNAGAAGLIALLAWAASRVVRRQAVVHGLWLLALVKLVTPPIAPLPLLPDWAGCAPLRIRINDDQPVEKIFQPLAIRLLFKTSSQMPTISGEHG